MLNNKCYQQVKLFSKLRLNNSLSANKIIGLKEVFNLITKKQKIDQTEEIINIRTDAIIFEASSFPIISEIFGATYPSKPTAAKKAKTHNNNDKNSFVKPLNNEMIPEEPITNNITRSVTLRPRVSTK